MIIGIGILLLAAIFSILFVLVIQRTDKNDDSAKARVEDVKHFYNNTTDKFLAVYGEIIQAFRTKDVDKYLLYTGKNLGIQGKMKLLDAGCGVAGPAVFFAKQFPEIYIDACSISEVQIEKAKTKVLNAGLENRVFVKCCDYHNIDKEFDKDNYDRVYFLESYGHSPNKERLLHAAWNVLKPGGQVYIKDLFQREVENEWEQHYIDKICQDINLAYKYHIGSLYETLSILRRKGFIIKFIKTPEVLLDEFEHLTISNEFQNLFDIGKIDSWDDYVFPIDFFEILAEKPIIPNDEERHLYFLNKL